jgi:hypothetical protein
MIERSVLRWIARTSPHRSDAQNTDIAAACLHWAGTKGVCWGPVRHTQMHGAVIEELAQREVNLANIGSALRGPGDRPTMQMKGENECVAMDVDSGICLRPTNVFTTE